MLLKEIFLNLNQLGIVEIGDPNTSDVTTVDMETDSLSKKVFDYPVVSITPYTNDLGNSRLRVRVIRK